MKKAQVELNLILPRNKEVFATKDFPLFEKFDVKSIVLRVYPSNNEKFHIVKVSLYSFLVLFLFATNTALASTDINNPTFVPSTVDPTGAGTAELNISIPETGGGNGWYFTKDFDILDDIQSNNFTDWCWPANSGSASAEETVLLTSSSHQIVSPNGLYASCNNTGVYYIIYRFGSSPDFKYYYTSYGYDSVQNAFLTNSPNQTYTQIVAPQPYGTTTATTSVDIDVSFKVSAGIDLSTVPAFNIGYRIYDAVTGELEQQYSDNFEENTALFFTYSTTTSLTQGSKTIKSFIENANTGVDLIPEDETFFNVVTNSYFEATGLQSPRDNPANLTQIDCDTFDIGCQFQKALTFLFVPSQTILDRYNSLWQTIRYKVPFGYVNVVIDQLSKLDETGARAFNLGELPFMSTVFTPFREAMAVILWGVYAIYFYLNRLTKLDI